MDKLRCSILHLIFVSWLFALLMAGCATIPLPTRSDRIGETGSVGGCADFFASLDKQTKQANALDPGVFRVKKYPFTYSLLSYTRFAKEIFTQLNYIIWFPSRPKEGAFDILGGMLDGLNYRVTLDNAGKPLVYETMHNCGCYYKAYPTDRLQVRAQIDYAEPPLILAAPAMNPSEDLMAVAMESRAHYVQHLYPLTRELKPAMLVYSLVDYGQLRSLPYREDNRQSMFGQDSIDPGSKRLERFILWPTGVLSPGAMRQWGRHAVAFAGKRHFDDPFFMDKMFVESEYDKLIKSPNLRHACEGRHPEYSENAGFPPSRE